MNNKDTSPRLSSAAGGAGQGTITDHSLRYLREHLLVTLAICIFAGGLVWTGGVSFIDRFLYDSFLRISNASRETEIVIVGIDEYSLREVGRWPWSRDVHARLLDQLTDDGAKAVFLDLIFAEEDRQRPEHDEALRAAIERNGNVYLPVHVEQLRSGGQLIEVMPHVLFAQAARGMGHVDLQLDQDGVARSFYMRSGLGQAWWPHVSLAMAEQLMPEVLDQYKMKKDEVVGSLANVREYHRYIPFAGAPGSYPTLSAADVLSGHVPARLLEGQIVLVGATAAGMGDMLPSPVSSAGELMSGVELNANILDGLLHDQLIRIAPLWVLLLVSLVLLLPVPLSMPFMLPRWSVLMVFASTQLQLLISYLAFSWGGYWLPVGAVVVSSLLCYPLWTWRRLESTLGYLRKAIEQLVDRNEFNKRLTTSASVEQLERFAHQVLPLQGWRLEEDGVELSNRGSAGLAGSWQGSQVRHREFRRYGKEYLFSVCFRDDVEITAKHERWLDDMVNRTAGLRVRPIKMYEVMGQHIARVEHEEQRQQSLNHFLNAIFAQMQDGFVLADACGVVLSINQQAASMLGLEQDVAAFSRLELVASYLELPEEYGSWVNVIRQVVESGSCQFECRNREGRELYIDLVTLYVGELPGRVFSLLVRDVSDLKEVMRSRSEMLDFLSHDLRSPMISLLALVERMRQDPVEVDAFLDRVESYSRRSLGISEQFLQLAKVEVLENIHMDPLDMLPVLESAIEQVQPQASERAMDMRFEYSPADEVWVAGNHELLERVVVNLLTNAVKYSHEGGRVVVSLALVENSVVCEVTDQGVGIPEEYQHTVFDRYTRASTSGGASTRGAGLGLRFVKVVADRHGGSIHLHSRVGEGSRFTLVLPAVDMDSL